MKKILAQNFRKLKMLIKELHMKYNLLIIINNKIQ